ncbi:phosphoribosyltransferase [Streptomyces sp. NPDC048473]|uniref:phosphoribosyltransferase n=1 Tax=unclassified Streptomyces TaxID=2593676 RepID=UPI00371637A5
MRTPRPGDRPAIQGRCVALVDDVVRSGGSLLTAARRLRIAGAKVTDALCVLERPLGGRLLPSTKAGEEA